MSNFEEKKYKKILTDETPDLWDKIDSQLTDDMYTTDSSDKPSPRIKRSRIYVISGIVAACICLLSIPLFNQVLQNTNNYKNNIDQSNGLKDNSELSIQADTDNSKEDNISDESSDNMNNFVDNNVKNNNTDDAAIINDNVTDNSSNNINKTSEVTLVMNITNIQYVDDIGRVYEGTVTKATPQSLTPKSTVYISLRNLSRTDLRKSADITSTLAITLNDVSYTSSAKNPYYATSINFAMSK